MMALTAATPIVKGRLAATDVRWSLISQSVDDRTPAERGEAPSAAPDSRMAGGGVRRQTKSRYDSISCFWAMKGDEQEFGPLTVHDFCIFSSLNIPEAASRCDGNERLFPCGMRTTGIN